MFGHDLLRPGVVLEGRFELRERLGGGGAGLVFRAWDRSLGEVVALKVLDGAPSETLRTRFAREVRVTRRLRHPNVVRVYGLVPATTEHPPLLTMQCIDGETLAARVARDGPLGAADALRIFTRLTGALAVAHRHGIVHRDVKPANVMLDASGEPFLLDFGAALEDGGAALTLAGAPPGTPGYMAPEQAQGERVGPAADVYGLGATIAFALGLGATPDEARGAKGWLGTILPRCLADTTANRYRDMASVERALRRRWTRPLVGGVVLAAVLVVGLAHARAAPERHVFVTFDRFAVEGNDEAWLRRGGPVILDQLLGDDPRLVLYAAPAPRVPGVARIEGRVVGTPPRLVVDVDERSAYEGHAGEDLGEQFEAAAETLGRSLGGGETAPHLGELGAWRHYVEALDFAEQHQGLQALAAAREAAIEDPDLARAQLLLVLLASYDSLGSKAEADAALQLATSRRGMLSRRDAELVSAIVTLGDYSKWGDPAPLRHYLDRHPGDAFAHRLAVRIGRPWRREWIERWLRVRPFDAEPYNQLGYQQLNEGDLASAEASFRETTRLAPDNPNGFDSLADVLFRRGRYEEGMAAARRGLALAPGFVSTLAKAAEFSLAAGALPEATALHAEAHATIDPESAQFAGVLRVGVGLHLVHGDVAGAVAYLEDAARSPRTAARAYVAEEMEGLILATIGDRAAAERAFAAAATAYRAYHAQPLPIRWSYAVLLASFDGPRSLATLDGQLDARTPDAFDLTVQHLWDARRAFLDGRPADALAALRLPRSTQPSQLMALPLLTYWTQAQALRALGKPRDARAALDEALRWQRTQPQWPEVSYFLPKLLDEAAQLHREVGDADEASRLDAYRATLTATASLPR